MKAKFNSIEALEPHDCDMVFGGTKGVCICVNVVPYVDDLVRTHYDDIDSKQECFHLCCRWDGSTHFYEYNDDVTQCPLSMYRREERSTVEIVAKSFQGSESS